MARPKMSDDATGNLKRSDETQETPKGTRVGLLPKGKVLADFKKIVGSKKRR